MPSLLFYCYGEVSFRKTFFVGFLKINILLGQGYLSYPEASFLKAPVILKANQPAITQNI